MCYFHCLFFFPIVLMFAPILLFSARVFLVIEPILLLTISALLCYKVAKNTSDEENNKGETHRASRGRGKTMTV